MATVLRPFNWKPALKMARVPSPQQPQSTVMAVTGTFGFQVGDSGLRLGYFDADGDFH